METNLNNGRIYTLRRVNMDELNSEFDESLRDMYGRFLNPNSSYYKLPLDDFIRITITMTIDGIHSKLSDGGNLDFPYDSAFEFIKELYKDKIIKRYEKLKIIVDSLNESTLNEVRVPREERVELYRDENIIVVVPLTHRALKKYGSGCQWCINGDLSEWEDYHKGLHAIIIQRKPKKLRIGITGLPIASEILVISRWGGGGYNLDDVNSILNFDFEDYHQLIDYEEEVVHDLNNFATNVVYYSPINGLYDTEDNNLGTYKFTVRDIPNVTPEVVRIMIDYLTKN